jgi:hypothetical protein
MDKQKIITELEEKFKKIKEKLKFKANLDNLDRAFSIRDIVVKDGFVSEDLSKQIRYRIVEVYMGWNDYLHSLIMPNPQNMLNISESKVLSAEQKKEITELMKKIMEISSRNAIINFTKDNQTESKLIDDALGFWENDFKKNLLIVLKKINEEWAKLK